MPTYNLRRQAQTDSSSVIAIMADTNRSVAVLLNPPSPTTTTTSSSSFSFSCIIALNQRQRRSTGAHILPLLPLLLAILGLVMRSDDVGTPHDGDAVESESSVRVRFYRRFFGREPVGCVRGACPSVSVFSLRRRIGKGNSLVRVARLVHKGVKGGRGAIYLPAMNSAAFQRSGSTCPLSSSPSRSRSRSPSCRRLRPPPPPSSRTATPADDDGAASTRRKTSRHRGCARSSGVSTRATNRGPRRADARIR